MGEGEPYALVAELVDILRTKPTNSTTDIHTDFAAATLTTIDGLRADFSHGFGLIRASNTTPMLILRFEGDNHMHLTDIQSRFRRLFTTVRPQLKLPF